MTDDAWINQYTQAMTPLQAGRVKCALKKPFVWRDLKGVIHEDTYASYAERMIQAGLNVEVIKRPARNEEGVKSERSLGAFNQSEMTAGVMNYAEFLMRARDNNTTIG